MREGEQSDRIYVVVDSSKTVRCMWCGVAESESWRHAEYGIFCSTDCAHAAAATVGPSVFIFTAFFSLCLLTMGGLGAVFLSVLLLAIGSPGLIYGIEGMRYRESVPKDSRRNEVSLETVLLRTVSASVNCPRCDANLDLGTIGKDRVYVCGYCGATGTIAIIDKSEQRGSGSGRSI